MKFLHLTVKEITEETNDTKTIHFWHPIHDSLHYHSGQFLTVIPEINGTKVRRSYSLSSSPKIDHSPAITVKRIPGGLVSNFLCDQIKVGDSLEVIEPMGNFYIEPDANAAKNYVFMGAGSGITPLLSMIKTVLKSEPKSHVYLIYGSRYESQIIFKSALNQLEQTYGNRLKVLHIISRPEANWPGLKGRINKASTVYYLKQEFGIDIASAHYYLCGPVGMMDEIQEALGMFDVPSQKIHRELFHSNSSVEEDSNDDDGSLKEQEVHIIYEGKEHKISVKPHETILEAALSADIDMPYSCQAGMCTACMGLCKSGKVMMDEEDGLTDNEIKKGYVLTCVAHPLSSGVVIDLD
ncbi:ferredoxin--NADP reductase [Aquirufa rosea]|uniref:Ferredoxin--NADP reductase n=1 Tax=Aquirufa rosea TaxID=2509241 RepID=A0A4V1M5N0_9BACT|nr:ferredoxin--NADP reductase [Aquirufa rosea]RXK50971.1 ferredoxin--NADP reductase [Aquirufa rosea]